MLKSIPNILTLSRIPLTGIFLYLLMQSGLEPRVWAAVVFALAALTDYFDGYLARKYHLNSDFGKLMDPVTDKVLTLSAFGVFAWMNLLPWWMFWTIFGREIGVTVFRLWANAKGVVLAAEASGKWKTALQMMVIIGVLLFLILGETGFFQSEQTGLFWIDGIFIGMLGVTVLTLQSGFSVIAGSLAKLERKKVVSRMPRGLARFIATFAGVGYTPKLPGTMASFVVCGLMAFWRPSTKAHLLTLAATIGLGWIVCRLMEEDAGQEDPSFVVIDEVAGVLISFLFLPVINWPVAVIVFMVFRYFDIRKVLGIRALESAGGSAGIMLDDILAGVYTNAVLQICLLGLR